MKTINEALEALKNCMRDGTLTPGSHVDAETFVCFSEQTATGIVYHQHVFDTLPEPIRNALKHRTRGERIGPVKILAIFDCWSPESEALKPATIKRPN